MDKQDWINEKISDLMYEDEYLEFYEALCIAEDMWYLLGFDEEYDYDV